MKTAEGMKVRPPWRITAIVLGMSAFVMKEYWGIGLTDQGTAQAAAG